MHAVTAENIVIDSEDMCVVGISVDKRLLTDFQDFYASNKSKEIKIEVLYTAEEHIMNYFKIIAERKYLLEFILIERNKSKAIYKLVAVKELVGNVLCIVQLERKQLDREYRQTKLDVINLTQSFITIKNKKGVENNE